MKHFILIILMASTLFVQAQRGIELGDQNEFNQFVPDLGSIGNSPLVFDKNNTPFFCYTAVQPGKDPNSPGLLKVMKRQNGIWIQTKDFAFAGPAYRPSLAVDYDGNVYVAFYNPQQVAVFKYNGTNDWSPVGVGNLDLGSSATSPIILRFDRNNTPYISGSRDNTDGSIIVKKFNGTSWVDIHPAGHLYRFGGSYSMEIAPGDSALYLTGLNRSYTGAKSASVIKYNHVANGWDTVGGAQILKDTSAANIDNIDHSIFFDANGVLHFYALQANGVSGIYTFGGTNWTPYLTLPPFSSTPFYTKNNVLHAEGNIFDGSSFQRYLQRFDGVKWDTLAGANPFIWDADLIPAQDTGGQLFVILGKNGSRPDFLRFDENKWETFGSSISGKLGVSAGAAFAPKIVLGVNDQPYILYQDATLGNKATVKKWDGNNWEILEKEGFTDGIAASADMAVDGFGVPYVVYSDEANGYKCTVKKYDGGAWSLVGTSTISDDTSFSNAITFDNVGNVMVVLTDKINDGKVSVKRFNGSWETIGNPGFSDGKASYVSIVADGSGTPHIVYIDEANGGKAMAKKYDGSKWVDEGANPVSDEEAMYTKIVQSNKGDLMMMFTTKSNRRITVKELKDNDWKDVGAAAASDSVTGTPSIGLDRAGSPVIIYPNGVIGHQVTMAKYIIADSKWHVIGAYGISAGAAGAASIAPSATTDTTFIAYNAIELFVRKYDNTNVGVFENSSNSFGYLTVYPNPSSRSFTIQSKTKFDSDMEVYDINGKRLMTIYTKGLKTVECNNLNLQPGIYVFKIGNLSHKHIVVLE